MSNFKFIIGLLVIFNVFLSCNNDDDNIPEVEIRDRAEQQIEDEALWQEYFATHYYNESLFNQSGDFNISDLIIYNVSDLSENESIPDGHLLLKDSDKLGSINVVHEETNYKFYILKLNEGGKTSATNFSDQITLNYRGNLPDVSDAFDGTSNPVRFDLLNLVPGWKFGIPEFKGAAQLNENSDGTIAYSDYGFGALFLPSGLAYFNQSQSAIPSYSNLIFRIELFNSLPIDHDNDNVPTHLEDGNFDSNSGSFVPGFGDYNPYNNDTDNDGNPDFLDQDDDGDGVLTVNEDLDEDGDPTNDIGINNLPLFLDDSLPEDD